MSTVRLAISGAAKLPVEVAQAIEAKFGLTLEEGYGLTEASPVVTSPRGTDAPAGSIGIPVPGLELRIVDAEGDDVLVGRRRRGLGARARTSSPATGTRPTPPPRC